MATGLNTDVERGGHVYHVQTERTHRESPAVETLVFRGGEVLVRVTAPCGEPGGSAASDDEMVCRLIETQHRSLIGKIRHGMLEDSENVYADSPTGRGGHGGPSAPESEIPGVLSDLDSAVSRAQAPVPRRPISTTRAGFSLARTLRRRPRVSIVVRWKPRPRTRVVLRLPW